MGSKLAIANQELKCGITLVTSPGTKSMESMENCRNTKPETRSGFAIRGEVIKMRTHQYGIQTTHGGS